MRNLQRNMTVVSWSRYAGKTEILDGDGNKTGLSQETYSPSPAATIRACVSPNVGTTEAEQFGNLEQYDRTLITSDPDCPLDEQCVVWLDGAPTDGPHNYIVVAKASWKNSVKYALRQVNLNVTKNLTQP